MHDFLRLALVVPAVFAMSAALATVTEPGAELQKLADGFVFTEGPACDAEGAVYFTDQPNDAIHKWSVDGKLTTFLSPSGRSNGLCFDADGNLWACADGNNELWKISPAGDVTVVLKDAAGRRMNGPNDLWFRPDGGLYFTDPYYERDYWNRADAPAITRCVYFLPKGGDRAVLVEDSLVEPNGIIGTPDGKWLYVSDIKPGKTYRYRIQEDGSLAERELFCEKGSDGMTIDSEGNVYLTHNDGVTVFNPEGKQIENIPVPERWTGNVCFGGTDGRTLFITADKGLYGIRMRVSGVGSQ